jgi:hypothetical protein
MGTTTEGMMVLRLDDGELLLVDVVGRRVGLLEDEECAYEEVEAVAAAAALRLLYCDASVMTEVAGYVIVDILTSGIVTRDS